MSTSSLSRSYACSASLASCSGPEKYSEICRFALHQRISCSTDSICCSVIPCISCRLNSAACTALRLAYARYHEKLNTLMTAARKREKPIEMTVNLNRSVLLWNSIVCSDSIRKTKPCKHGQKDTYDNERSYRHKWRSNSLQYYAVWKA